jgi:hypothetical protein
LHIKINFDDNPSFYGLPPPFFTRALTICAACAIMETDRRRGFAFWRWTDVFLLFFLRDGKVRSVEVSIN